MGTFVFQWTKPAEEVYVTGSFDDWAKTEKLVKDGSVFTKRVVLPSSKESYYFKYFVDGAWQLDTSFPSANDAAGNTNNILKPEDITPLPAGATSAAAASLVAGGAFQSGVGPNSTTAALAGQVPLEKDVKHDDHMPGAFPDETPTPSQQSTDFNLNPAARQASDVQVYPGDMVPDYGSYGTQGKPAEPTFGVSPLPATAGTGNPVSVKPGEPLPPTSSYTDNTIGSHVKLDKASYEKSDAYPTAGASSLNTGSGAFGVPPVSGTMIPESSLPMGAAAGGSIERDAGPTISSTAGANTTTAALAGQVPLEPRGVPEVVKESQEAANAPKEASASPAAVANKDKVEDELTKKVPEEPATSQDYPAAKMTSGAIGAAAAGGAALLGGAAAAVGLASGKAQKAAADVKEGKNPITGSGGVPKPGDTAPGVPAEVSESEKLANASPEAASNPAAVAHKSAMEAELERKVPVAQSAGSVGPSETHTAALNAKAPGQPTHANVDAFKNDPTKATASSQASAAASNASTAAKGAGAAIAGAAAGAAAALGLSSKSNDASQSNQSSSQSTQQQASQAANHAVNTASAKAQDAAAAIGLTSKPASGGLNAPASNPAQSVATETGQLSQGTPPAGAAAPSAAAHSGPTSSVAGAGAVPARVRHESRDVSPMSRGPAVTSGVAEAPIEEKSGWKEGSEPPTRTTTAQKPAPAGTTSGTATKEEKKKNRRSFFGKIKDKFKEKM